VTIGQDSPIVEQSCTDRMREALAALDIAQPSLNAATVIRADAALAEAADCDRRAPSARGPLHGVPVMVKDLFDVAGLPTTGGCAAYEGRVARHDSAVVRALRQAGAIVIAKANQHELGAGATGLVSCFGAALHPADRSRVTGGSSSGSAVAVAGGIVPLAIGSDTGGSIRIPSSFCGLTGLRTTPGRVSLQGAQPMSPGYDTAGPIALTAHQCAIAFAALAVARPRPADPLAGLRIGLPRPYFRLCHADTAGAVEGAAAAFARLGARVAWTDGPSVDRRFSGFRHVWADVAHHHRDVWGDPRVSADVAALIERGRRMTGLEYADSRAHAEQVRREMLRAFRDVDLLLMPSTPYPAPRIDDEEVVVDGGTVDVHRGGPSVLTVPVNLAGVPAVSFPVGTGSEGLPLGAQLVGPPGDDELLLAVVESHQRDSGRGD
jgi:Asp-tRNA(Asn)/Glu-tRNA(Gln) amidotransferase A subunit family amidase